VDGTDLVLVRDNNTNFLTALKLIATPEPAAGASEQMMVLSLAVEPMVVAVSTAEPTAPLFAESAMVSTEYADATVLVVTPLSPQGLPEYEAPTPVINGSVVQPESLMLAQAAELSAASIPARTMPPAVQGSPQPHFGLSGLASGLKTSALGKPRARNQLRIELADSLMPSQRGLPTPKPAPVRVLGPAADAPAWWAWQKLRPDSMFESDEAEDGLLVDLLSLNPLRTHR
jgi:hypothetical protein